MEKIMFYIGFLLIHLTSGAQHRSDTLLHLMRKAGIPALSLVYVKEGKLQEHCALGVGSNETLQPINDSTIFSATSLSKSVFSYAVFSVIREKKLDLDKPLYRYYDYKDVADDPRSKQVTTRMVLSHTSGLPNWRDNDSLHFKVPPGETFNYSGESMVWLSRVVEAITGQDIETYTKEKIFEPLHMTHTSYIWQQLFEENVAYPHIDIGQTMSKSFPRESNVAQSLQTTAIDYATFLVTILQDKRFMAALQTEPTVTFSDGLSWGMGLGRQTTKEGVAFRQWGDNGTIMAFLIGYPGKKEGVVYFTNTFHGLKIAKDILQLFFSSDQPSLAWLNTDSADALDLQVFEKLLQAPVTEAVRPYYLAGMNNIDTTKLSLSKMAYLGNRFIQLRQFNKAAEILLEGLKVDSTSENLYAGLAEAYLQSGNREAASQAIFQAARLNPAKAIYRTMENKLGGRHIPPQAGEKLIVFRLPDYMSARHVTLVVTFNDWNDFVEPMRWQNGAWTTSIPLPKGSYRYKFVVDGV